jgi:hypothetical protein
MELSSARSVEEQAGWLFILFSIFTKNGLITVIHGEFSIGFRGMPVQGNFEVRAR